MSFEDNAYTSKLYRLRQSHKRHKRKSSQKLKPQQEKQEKEEKDELSDISDYAKFPPLQPVENKRNSISGADDYAERMRTAAVMLAQLQQNTTASPLNQNIKSKQGTEQIRQRIIKEMLALEEQRMTKMKTEGVGSGVGGGGGEGAGGDMLEDEQRIAMVVNKEDPSGEFYIPF